LSSTRHAAAPTSESEIATFGSEPVRDAAIVAYRTCAGLFGAASACQDLGADLK
jgi:hypothetical protein